MKAIIMKMIFSVIRKLFTKVTSVLAYGESWNSVAVSSVIRR